MVDQKCSPGPWRYEKIQAYNGHSDIEIVDAAGWRLAKLIGTPAVCLANAEWIVAHGPTGK